MGISSLKSQGGTDFSKTTGSVSPSITTSHSSITILDITGTGYLTGLSVSGLITAYIQIDGGVIRRFDTASLSLLWRFKTSLKITSNVNGIIASYILE